MNEVTKKYYYTIGEVSRILDLKQYVIRYWETEFTQLHPKKDHGRNRKYSEENIDLLRTIKDMLYNQKYTIDGARQKLSRQNKTKKFEQLEFEFQRDETPMLEEIAEPANVDTILITFRQRLHEFSKEIQNFKERWNVKQDSVPAKSKKVE